MHQPGRTHLTTEVLELGESLFELALQSHQISQTPTPQAPSPEDPYPEAELRAAAAEFFTSLRLLLGVE